MYATSDDTVPSLSALDRLLFFGNNRVLRYRHPRALVGLIFAAGTWNVFVGLLWLHVGLSQNHDEREEDPCAVATGSGLSPARQSARSLRKFSQIPESDRKFLQQPGYRRWLGLVPLAAGALQCLGGFRLYRIRVSPHHPRRSN
jgi:hypothetical protein